jgi:tetratricopeptide (TPR) repeat protein
MKHIGSVLASVTGAAVPTRQEPPALPPAETLAPQAATTLGSQLLSGGAYEQALPYLVRGIKGRPSAFAWCRLGKLCRDAGHPEDAVRCYDEALLLAPGDRYACIGRAAALADVPDAPLDVVLDALTEVLGLLAGTDDPTPAAWTAYGLMRSVSARFPHPAIRERTEALKRLARTLDRRSQRDRRCEIERELDAALRIRELLGAAVAQSAVDSRASEPALEPGKAPRMLGSGT